MGNKIQLTAADGHNFSAYVAERPENRSWLVVIQEAFGVNSHIRNVCDRFAESGFNAVAPALFDRVEREVELPYTPEGVARYVALREQMPRDSILADVQAAADHVGNAKVGIVGYCFGGTVSWWAATSGTRFAGSSCWYGGQIYAEKDAKPNCPVQMHFGGNDPHIPLDQVEAIRTAQPQVDVFVYEGADHGFGCDQRPAFNAGACTLAFQRTLDFFHRNLE